VADIVLVCSRVRVVFAGVVFSAGVVIGIAVLLPRIVVVSTGVVPLAVVLLRFVSARLVAIIVVVSPGDVVDSGGVVCPGEVADMVLLCSGVRVVFAGVVFSARVITGIVVVLPRVVVVSTGVLPLAVVLLRFVSARLVAIIVVVTPGDVVDSGGVVCPGEVADIVLLCSRVRADLAGVVFSAVVVSGIAVVLPRVVVVSTEVVSLAVVLLRFVSARLVAIIVVVSPRDVVDSDGVVCPGEVADIVLLCSRVRVVFAGVVFSA